MTAKICKRYEVWSDPTIIVMDYDELTEMKQPNGSVAVFFDYDPKPGKVYSLDEIPENVTALFLDQEGIKGLIDVLVEMREGH